MRSYILAVFFLYITSVFPISLIISSAKMFNHVERKQDIVITKILNIGTSSVVTV